MYVQIQGQQIDNNRKLCGELVKCIFSSSRNGTGTFYLLRQKQLAMQQCLKHPLHVKVENKV